MKKLFTLLMQVSFALFLNSCATEQKVEIENLDRSLIELTRAVKAVMGEPRAISENQREFYSTYFSRVPSDKFDPNKSKERLTARFIILGDRRPYNIEITVFIQRRNENGYQVAGTDKGLANELRKELKAKLAQGQGGMNVIDDFRAF